MKSAALCLLILCAANAHGATAETAQTGAEERATATVAQLVLKVTHPREAREALLAMTAELGGFPTLVTDERLVLQVPPAALDRALETASGRGLLVEKRLSRTDLTMGLAHLAARLRSKESILTRLRSEIERAGLGTTLAIERTMSGLVVEMESLKGQLRVQRARARWASLDVAFQFRQRDRIIDIRSPFEWLNTVDLDAFLGRF